MHADVWYAAREEMHAEQRKVVALDPISSLTNNPGSRAHQ
jgi:hypothetical protein